MCFSADMSLGLGLAGLAASGITYLDNFLLWDLAAFSLNGLGCTKAQHFVLMILSKQHLTGLLKRYCVCNYLYF